MFRSLYPKVLLACASFLIGFHAARAQSLVFGTNAPEAHTPARLDVAIAYNPVLANVTTPSDFGMNGGSAEVQAKVWRRAGVVADIAGLHAGDVNNTGVPLDLLTVTFGPRYTWAPAHHRMRLFGQALLGDAHGLSGLFPTKAGLSSTGNSFAFQAGVGVDLPLWNRLSLRALDAQWLHTYFPNATTNVQNNLRLGMGVVYRFR